MVVSYRRVGTACPLQRGPIGFPETSVGHNNSKQRQSPKERRSHLHDGGRLKSRVSTIRADGRTGRQTDGNRGEKRFIFRSFPLHAYRLQITIYRTVTCVFFIWSTKEPSFDSRQGQRIFLPFRRSRVALGSNKPPIQWDPVTLPGIKQPECEADPSPPG
jgi:hypothetical protein